VLLKKCIEALQQFKVHVSDSEADSIAAAVTMVTRLAHICGPHGDVDEKEFRNSLTQLYTEGKPAYSNYYVRCIDISQVAFCQCMCTVRTRPS
jgi:hypothetical protein